MAHMQTLAASHEAQQSTDACNKLWDTTQVPAVILVCRNSTDTAYFQRLRPYPRIMLLRYNTRFKDYVRTSLALQPDHA